MDGLLTVKQAADRAGVSLGLVYEWCATGQLAHFRLGRKGKRGSIRISEADLDLFVSSCRKGGREPPRQPPPVRLKHLS